MTFTGISVIFFTVTVVLPGYLTSHVLSVYRARIQGESRLEFMRWIALSTLDLSPLLALVVALFGDHFTSQHDAWLFALSHRATFAILWILAVLVWPIVVGECLVWLRNRRIGFALRYSSERHPRSHHTSWDAMFSQLDRDEGDWILVALRDGGWIVGIFGKGSHAAIDPAHRDLYISRVEYTSRDSTFYERFDVEVQGGIYIPAELIRYIRFWD